MGENYFQMFPSFVFFETLYGSGLNHNEQILDNRIFLQYSGYFFQLQQIDSSDGTQNCLKFIS